MMLFVQRREVAGREKLKNVKICRQSFCWIMRGGEIVFWERQVLAFYSRMKE